METLSDELLVHTLQFVGWAEVASKAVLVCRRWRDVGRDDALWRFFFLSHSWQPQDDGTAGKAEAWIDRFRRRRDEVEWWRGSFVPARSESWCKSARVRLPPTRIDDLPAELVPTPNQQLRVVVLGAPSVGKSSLVLRLIQGVFAEGCSPTIEDAFRKQITVNGASIVLDVLELVAQEDHSVMRDTYVQSGQAFILLYSATSVESFRALDRFYDQINRVQDAVLTPIVMVENKIDLVDERQVPKDAGEKAARALGCLFVAASAKTGDGVEEAFSGAAKLCLAVRAELHRVAQQQPKRRTTNKNCLLA